jgi:hypothetical protein
MGDGWEPEKVEILLEASRDGEAGGWVRRCGLLRMSCPLIRNPTRENILDDVDTRENPF